MKKSALVLAILFLLPLSVFPANFVKDKVAQKSLDHAVTIVVYYYMDEYQYNELIKRLADGHKPFLVNPIGKNQDGEYVISYIGSGGVIRNDYVLTASHLFDDTIYYTKMEIVVYRQLQPSKFITYTAEIACKTNLSQNNGWNDYAVIKVHGRMKLPGLKLAKNGLDINDKMIWCGSMVGFFPILRCDYVSYMKNYLVRDYEGVVKVKSWTDYYLYCFHPGAPGDSGTPILNKKGKIIGVLCWGMTMSNDHVYVLSNPHSKLVKFIEDNDLMRLFK